MNKHTGKTQAIFLLGDQVYIDATDQLLNVKSLRAKNRYRYERAFSKKYSPEFARLTKYSPTHFTLDDHEFEDGWSGTPGKLPDATPLEKERRDTLIAKFDYGLRNAIRFQSSGRNKSNRFFSTAKTPFSYPLAPSELALPAFVLDSRTGREFRDSDDPMYRDMISKSVKKSLEVWLCEAQKNFGDAPKFIMSGSVIAPINKSYLNAPSLFRRQDNWHGYPKTVVWLFRFLLQNDIQNVVLVGGDEHLSAVAKLNIRPGTNELDSHDSESNSINAWQIVASALYSPMPFANSREADFLWDQEIAIPLPVESNLSACYTASRLSSCSSQFVKVSACKNLVTSTCYDANNTAINSKSFDLSKQEIIPGAH
jgi:phosphodiesterase/alkaline phosphatase D-like protein